MAPRTEEVEPARPDPSPRSRTSLRLPPGLRDPLRRRELDALHDRLREVLTGDGGDRDLAGAVRCYLELKQSIKGTYGHFGIVNNRVHLAGDVLLVPYLAGDTLLVHMVSRRGRRLRGRRVPDGLVLTDGVVYDVACVSGEPVDLEPHIFGFGPGQAEPVRVGRLSDMTSLLARVNGTTNRNEAVYYLRSVIARLCSPSFEALVGAKNLQPETRDLERELVRFLESPMARRVPHLARLLVRNVSNVVLRPNLIDRLWNDTIALAEVHVAGSGAVNELRRSTHHALGRRTLRMADAYLRFLEGGDADLLAEAGLGQPSSADLAAAGDPETIGLVRRVVGDLEELLGDTQVVERIRDWRTGFERSLLLCDYGRDLHEELRLARAAARAGNRWAWSHHLGILRTKADAGAEMDAARRLSRELERLEASRPGDEGFDPQAVSSDLEEAVERFARELLERRAGRLLRSLERIMRMYAGGERLETYREISDLRLSLWESMDGGGLDGLRIYAYQLDCLLEEMGYLALSHVREGPESPDADMGRWLEVIRLAVRNLALDGKFSRELTDLSVMLVSPGRTDAELVNLLEQVRRSYHKLVQRVTAPYERMRERIGIDADQLRSILGNMKRYMHDLNSMVRFCDMALSALRAGGCLRAEPPPEETGEPEVVHLSHLEDVVRLVEEGCGGRSIRELYGGKGTGLLYISYLGIPTRDGFLLPATVGRSRRSERAPGWLGETVLSHLDILRSDVERHAVRSRGGGSPLLVAVRGGSVLSMPGILPTSVFVGMNDGVASSLAEEDPWHSYDSYRRFLASFAKTLWDVDIEDYGLVDGAKRRYGVAYKSDLPWEGMREVAENSKRIIGELGHGDELDRLLDDPREQVVAAVEAVYRSWERDTPRRYREIKGVCDSWHTAVVVQQMASGNRSNEPVGEGMDEYRASLTGVIPHTRTDDMGIRKFTGEIKFSAAGDDLVGGMTGSSSFRTMVELTTLMPMLNRRLRHIVAKLRRFQGTDQEIEFTVDRGVLSVLQSRSAEAAHDRAVTAFDDPGPPATRGIGIRGGCFRGLVAFEEEDLRRLSSSAALEEEDVDGVLMVMDNPAPDEIPVILQAGGLLTARGGSSTHAAVAINGMSGSYSAVMSAAGLHVDAVERRVDILDAEGRTAHRMGPGEIISIHGTTGEVFAGGRRLRGQDTGPGTGGGTRADGH